MSPQMETLINEIYSKPLKKTMALKKIAVGIDNTWSLDMIHYGYQNKRGFRNILVVIDNFSKFGLTPSLKDNKEQAITNAPALVFQQSGRRPKMINC